MARRKRSATRRTTVQASGTVSLTIDEALSLAGRFLALRGAMAELDKRVREAADAYDIRHVRGGIIETARVIAESLSFDGSEVGFVFPELLCEIMVHADKNKPHPVTATPKARVMSWRNDPARLGVQAFAAAVFDHFDTGSSRSLSHEISTAMAEGGALNERRVQYSSREIKAWRKELADDVGRKARLGEANYLERRQIELKHEWFRKHATALAKAKPTKERALAELTAKCIEFRAFFLRR